MNTNGCFLTSQIVASDWDFKAIAERYSIFKIKKGRVFNKNILDIADDGLKIVSTVYLNDNNIFIMTSRGIERDVLESAINKGIEKRENRCSVQEIKLYAIRDDEEKKRELFGYGCRSLLQLLINATLNSDPINEYNNITGRCYYLNPKWNKDLWEKKNVEKLELVDFTVSLDNSIYPSVCTFSKLTADEKKDFNSNVPKVVLDKNPFRVRRALKRDSIDDIYIKRNLDVERTEHNFDGTAGDTWEMSKLYCMHKFFSSLRDLTGVEVDFVKIDNFETLQMDKGDDDQDKVKAILRDKGVFLSDMAPSYDFETQKAKNFASKTKIAIIDGIKQYCLHNGIAYNEGKSDMFGCNIHLIRDESFYGTQKAKEQGISDGYVKNKDVVLQRITIPCESDIKHTLNVVFKELAIKDDLFVGKIRITDWKKFGFTEDICFYDAVCRSVQTEQKSVKAYDFSGMTIHTDGSFEIDRFSLKEDELPQTLRHFEIRNCFWGNDGKEEYFMRGVELVAFPSDRIDDAVIIKRTNIRTIPDFQVKGRLFLKEKNNERIPVDKLLSCISAFEDAGSESERIAVNTIREYSLGKGEISKSELICLLKGVPIDEYEEEDKRKANRIPQRLKNLIEKEFGIVLKYSRQKDTMEKTGDIIYSHIHVWKSENVDENVGNGRSLVYNYAVGQKDIVNVSIPKAIVVRQMYSSGGSSVDDGFVRKLFDLMKVRFVRYNNYTVLPFPAKYLREARNIRED